MKSNLSKAEWLRGRGGAAGQVCSQKEDAESLEALLATLNLSEDPAERKGELEKQSKGLESKIRKQETRAGRSLEDLQVLTRSLLHFSKLAMHGRLELLPA